LMLAAAALGTSISVATPQGYAPSQEMIDAARKIARSTGAIIDITHDAVKAVTGANAIYTDVWASMGQEDEAAERATIFAPYQVNERLFSHAAPHAVFMHCLPAHRGQEVTAGVIDSPRSIVFDQAENRMHIQKAILLLLLGSGMRTTPTRSNHA
jgi:ornithine carbamoyltransferase